MAKRGPKPKKLVDTTWSGDFAYSLGLLATDGCLARTQTLVDLTSKDKEQLQNFNKCIGLNLKIAKKNTGYENEAWRVQIKNRIFYDFLISIGFTPAKSRTIKKISIPSEYFFDFLRGCFDGDGSFYSYWDTRWKSSFMFYTSFVSASRPFILWIRKEIQNRINIKGHLGSAKKKNIYYQLKYAKGESLQLIEKMYENPKGLYLTRKKLKIDKALAIMYGSNKCLTK